MGILKNPRHEAFARHYVKHGVARHAYVAAGYRARLPAKPSDCAPVDVCASQLLKFPKVATRIERLRQAMAKRAEVTEESILEELEEARMVSRANGQGAAMTSASVAKAKLVGLMIERKESGDVGDFGRMTEQQLRDYLNDNAPQPQPTHSGTSTEQ